MTLTCGAFAGMMIISQASPIAQQMMGFSPEKAAAVVSLLALFNMLGRLASGMLSDRLGALGTMRLTFGISIIAGIMLFFCTDQSPAIFYVGLAFAGFGFGSIMGIYPGFTAQKFGRKYNSVNYGIMFIGFALAGFLTGAELARRLNVSERTIRYDIEAINPSFCSGNACIQSVRSKGFRFRFHLPWPKRTVIRSRSVF